MSKMPYVALVLAFAKDIIFLTFLLIEYVLLLSFGHLTKRMDLIFLNLYFAISIKSL